MIKLSITTRGLSALVKSVTNTGRRIRKRQQGNFTKVGLRVSKTAKRYSKISPIDDPYRGSLQRAITFRVGNGYVKIFVPRNSKAGQYAYLQHEVIEGRGTGTVRKGAQAGWKFIIRSIRNHNRTIRQLLLVDPVEFATK